MLLSRYSNTGFGGEIFSEIERFKLYRTNLIIILLDESKGILNSAQSAQSLFSVLA